MAAMTPWQHGFCLWNAERLGISKEESFARYQKSWSAVPGGHGGDEFREIDEKIHDIFSVLIDDSPKECLDAYKYHGNLHFLRMLSYPQPSWPTSHPIVAEMARRPNLTVVDYGCGLAHSSITIMDGVRQLGGDGELILIDIPTMRWEFLDWFTSRLNIRHKMVSVTDAQPVPEIPDCDLLIATEVFEHIYNPVEVLAKMESAIKNGGIMITNLRDHEKEFFHVSCDLSELREYLDARGYRELSPMTIYQKPVK